MLMISNTTSDAIIAMVAAKTATMIGEFSDYYGRLSIVKTNDGEYAAAFISSNEDKRFPKAFVVFGKDYASAKKFLADFVMSEKANSFDFIKLKSEYIKSKASLANKGQAEDAKLPEQEPKSAEPAIPESPIEQPKAEETIRQESPKPQACGRFASVAEIEAAASGKSKAAPEANGHQTHREIKKPDDSEVQKVFAETLAENLIKSTIKEDGVINVVKPDFSGQSYHHKAHNSCPETPAAQPVQAAPAKTEDKPRSDDNQDFDGHHDIGYVPSKADRSAKFQRGLDAINKKRRRGGDDED